MSTGVARVLASISCWALLACSGSVENPREPEPPALSDARSRFLAYAPPELPAPPADPTNRYLDDPRAAVLGKKFFFETRFSGPLLDEANNGLPGTLGVMGEAGKVGCSGCHVPGDDFLDSRSPRRQISLGSGWTRRRAPSLLNVAQAQLLLWDGRRDTAFSQPFTPIEDPLEFNSSRLFVAQQIAKLYRTEYEDLFGPLPDLSEYAEVAPADAGCNELPTDVAHGTCIKPGYDDDAVTRVVVNMGKAIQAFTRKLTCGRSRFDRWVDGDDTAITADELAGANVFTGKAACHRCHMGPYFTDQQFHNVGMHPDFTFFITAIDDPGAAEGLPAMLADPLGSTGQFSDGQDGRRNDLQNLDDVLGAFRTPGLRCVSRRPSFMHTGQFRSLEDVVIFFNRGGDPNGYMGASENYPRELSDTERHQLVAFLKALDGEGPDPELVAPPELPPDL